MLEGLIALFYSRYQSVSTNQRNIRLLVVPPIYERSFVLEGIIALFYNL